MLFGCSVLIGNSGDLREDEKNIIASTPSTFNFELKHNFYDENEKPFCHFAAWMVKKAGRVGPHF